MIELQRRDAIFTLSLCNGENRFTNAFIRTFNARLDEIIEQAGDGPAALIVTGEGKYWSNGIDLEGLQGASSEDQAAFLPELNRLLGRLVCFPLPTAAAINGHTFAGGGLLALALDYRVMRSERGWFCLPEVDIQVPFAPAMLALLRAKLAPGVLRDAVLTGARYTGDEALAAGIVDAVCELEELATRTSELLAPIGQKARPTFAKFKHDLYGALAAELGYSAGA